MRLLILLLAESLSLSLSACALPTPRPNLSLVAPPQWYAPLPHHGTLTDLTQWWNQLGDPLLVQLISSAQIASPTLAAAKTRIGEAQVSRVSTAADLLPSLDAVLSGTQSSAQPPVIPENTVLYGGLKSSWEIDLFGAKRAQRDSAQARLEGAQAGWHEARVAVAAELANSYYNFRTCEELLRITRLDAQSRSETARLSALSAEAGFMAPASAALAHASAAEGNGRAAQQQAQCDLYIKSLVALSALSEPALRQLLKQTAVPLPSANSIVIASIPAQVLAQRPDVYRAERELVAARLDVGDAQAQRYPHLNLSGAIGATRFSAGAMTTNLSTWSIGPLALTVPLFDGGQSKAKLQAARIRYEEAAINYQSTVRNAVREVEQALVNLQSTGARGEYVIQAVEGFRTSLGGTESLYQNGLASLYELEESRRTRLAAELALVSLQQERISAWISLYRAAGGGWDVTQQGETPLTPDAEPRRAQTPAASGKKSMEKIL